MVSASSALLCAGPPIRHTGIGRPPLSRVGDRYAWHGLFVPPQVVAQHALSVSIPEQLVVLYFVPILYLSVALGGCRGLERFERKVTTPLCPPRVEHLSARSHNHPIPMHPARDSVSCPQIKGPASLVKLRWRWAIRARPLSQPRHGWSGMHRGHQSQCNSIRSQPRCGGAPLRC